ncbi:Hpt domain-containing protein [Desulfobaculum sp. SPO524]|uniref:Hpt domain-containing protein n=1 Tax=Desulfobaculum sp. SPO524 TaxID=3378071 RepID=UPI00385246B0
MMDFSQDKEVLDAFIEESRERLSELESGVLELEEHTAADEAELLNSVFRAAHSVKAGAGLLKLHSIERVSHWLENLLGRVRTGEIQADSDLVTALLEGVDALRELIDDVPDCADRDVTEQLADLRSALDFARVRQRD